MGFYDTVIIKVDPHQIVNSEKTRTLLLLLPRRLRREFLQIVHDSPLGGHMGRDCTWDRTRGLVWWPAVKVDVTKYVAGCDVCKRVKHGSKRKAPLEKTDIPKQPFQRIQMDFCWSSPGISAGRLDVRPCDTGRTNALC